MTWKLPAFVIGLAAPGLLVLAWQNIPHDLIVFRSVEVEKPRVFAPTPPVTFVRRSPVPGLDPFREVLPRTAKRSSVSVEQAVIQMPSAASQAPTAASRAGGSSPAVTGPAAPDLPDPQLEGVVAGDNPVAVIKVGEESQFVKVGQRLAGGLEVLSITDGEVRLKRGASELVLKTGIR